MRFLSYIICRYKNAKKTQNRENPVAIIMLVLTMACLIAFSLFAINFSTIFYILIGGTVGLIIYLIGLCMKRNNKNKEGGKE